MRDLLEAALIAYGNAHAPYSRFQVGAAVRTGGGRIFAGANVENASFPEGNCAEASALVVVDELAVTEVSPPLARKAGFEDRGAGDDGSGERAAPGFIKAGDVPETLPPGGKLGVEAGRCLKEAHWRDANTGRGGV